MNSSLPYRAAVTSVTDEVRDYYCTPRATSVGGPLLSRYEIWENGEALNDSVTPSTYCAAYRAHMTLKILSLATSQRNIFSIGCGNAFVEADLVARGFCVQAIDYNAEAVELAAGKGVEAFTSDYWALPAGFLAKFDLIYADGLLGHLYRPDTGLDRFFEALAA